MHLQKTLAAFQKYVTPVENLHESATIALSDNFIVAQQVKKFLAFYGIRRFITLFARDPN
jgi:hypothetical protein